jgi:HlyD family secretion protein
MPPPTRLNRATQIAIWGIALFILAAALIAVRSFTREHVSIRTAQASYRDLAKSFPANGKVEPIDQFQAHAQAAGQVQQIYVDTGERVKAGQLLLRMDDAYALANLAHANSTLQAAQLAAADIQHGGNQDERNTFASDLARARLQRQQDASDLAARQKLLQQGADARASVTAARSTYAAADFRSPFAGTAFYIPVAEHDYVETGEELADVADLSRMRITAYFDEAAISNLAAGQPVTITWEAKPDVTWHGHISKAPTSIINYLTRFVGECLITVDDANGNLQPHANVNVNVTTAAHHHVLTIPHEALHFAAGKPYVFRVVDKHLVRTDVQLDGIVTIDEAEITGGLSEGDTVALSATTNRYLTDGLEVDLVQ